MKSNGTRSINTIVDKYLRKYLMMDEVTEVCYNGDGVLHVLNNNGWSMHQTDLTYDSVYGLAQAIAAFTSSEFDEGKPLLGAYLPTEERIQFVMPPATATGIIAFSIRVPSRIQIPHKRFVEEGLYKNLKSTNSKLTNDEVLTNLYKEKDYETFIQLAVKNKKTIVISGATGSGKTTYMKSIIDFIPKEERLISIEDVDEIKFYKHKNTVKLYYPEGANTGDGLTSSTLLKSCLRMKPDRILLAEVRGSETFDFINVISSGHQGSITSCHAGNIDETFSRLVNMILENPKGQKIPYEIIEKMLKSLIDVVLHIEFDSITGERYITELYYKGASK